MRIDSRLKKVYSEITWRTLDVHQVGSPKELDGAFVEVNALASVDGEIPW